MLDVGCGSGALLHRNQEEGTLTISGVEPGLRFRAELAGGGFDVRATLSMFAGERFDAQ